PAYNEAGNVTPVIDKVARAFEARGVDGEVVFVDDGSTDGTGTEAAACAKRYPFVKIISHRRNLGLTEALRTGFRHVSGDTIILLPGDLESDPEEDIPKLLDKLAEGYDVVAGWRQGRHDSKIVASKIYNFASRLLFNVQAHDMNWIKAFRREVIEGLYLRSDWHRFILMIAASQGYKIGEVPTNYYPRRQGRSKFGLGRIPVSFLDVLVVKFLLTFSRKPMIFFGSLGLVLILAASGIGVYLLQQWFTRARQLRPVFTFGVILALAGLIIFLVGFLAELVVDQHERICELERIIKDLARDKERP
ncbi:MAG TPA: glycosyltransferase, partial [Anaerolineae bacterium]|nr:glycosyltransferase [Anaerolineae bacterium]